MFAQNYAQKTAHKKRVRYIREDNTFYDAIKNHSSAINICRFALYFEFVYVQTIKLTACFIQNSANC